MTKKEFYSKLKYKNVAFIMACCLLGILAVGSACRDNGKQTSQPAEPAAATAKQQEKTDKTEPEAPAQNKYEKGKAATDFKYIEVRKETGFHKGLLMPYEGDEQYNGGRPEELEGVYEYLLDDKGGQIAYARSVYIYLTKETLEHFNAMIRDFRSQTGHADLMIADGYVPETLDTNDNEYWTEDYKKKAMCEEHFLGTAIDLKIYDGSGYPEFTGEGDYQWLVDNMSAYGFIQRYPEGKEEQTGSDSYPGHIRFVGYPDSQIMHDKGLCLEEYIEEIKKYDYKNQLVLTDTHGGKYCVYYVAADEKSISTNVPVPIKGDEELKYRISGDGKEGFIVSCMVEGPK